MIVRHPYTFVPFPALLARKDWPETGPQGHERFLPGTVSGAFDCVLTAVSPLCVKEHFKRIHWNLQSPYLPGASLKGMLRNTMQVLGFGCVGPQQLFQNKKALKQEEEGIIPRLELGDMAPCTQRQACLVCRLFGYGVKTEKGRDEKEPFGWAAKIRVLDSAPAIGWNDHGWMGMNDAACWVDGHPPAQPQDQGPRHKAFYYPFGDGRPAGWKVYRHARRLTRIDDGYTSGDCVKAGTQFAFRVEFENLTDEEFGAFEFALTLTHICQAHKGPTERALVHKLGYGKSVGMGSCRVSIKSRESMAVRRFFGKDPPPLHEPACQIAELLDSDIFRAFSSARSTEKAADVLLFPTWKEFKDHAAISIEEFDRKWEKRAPRVDCPGADAQQTLQPVRPLEALPAVVKGVVTSVKSNVVKGETTDEFNGFQYRFEVVLGGVGVPQRGAVITITVDSAGVDHATHRFRGKRWQA